MPVIDIMILTHNHYDHLDKKTLSQLVPKTKTWYTALGVGKDLEACGANAESIHELDWWDTEKISGTIQLTATPARHFSGRGLKRGGSLWASFVLQIDGYRLFLGGDSGYDTHFKKIGDQFGPFDLALLECGQYSIYWPYIHMMPEETLQAAADLKAKVLMPVHWGKFSLSTHPWNEPVKRLIRAAEIRAASAGVSSEVPLQLTTPRIGEPVVINESYPADEWWKV